MSLHRPMFPPKADEKQPSKIGTPSNVVKLPYSVTRRAYTRRPRRLKNGSPEERALLAAATERAQGHVLRLVEAPNTSAPKVPGADEAQISSADRDGWFRRFAQRLRAARIALGISEEEAAAAAGRSVLTWRKYEATGRGRCTFALMRFAEHYRVSLDDLLRDEEVPAPAYAPDAVLHVLSETGRNEQLRRDRRDAWRKAEARLEYWRAWRNVHFNIQIAFNYELLDEIDCPAALRKMNDFKQPWILGNELLRNVRAAEIKLLLTPAPTVAAVNWKRATFNKGWYQVDDADAQYLRKHIGVKRCPYRDIEQAIADDEAWLEAHPARQCRHRPK